MGSLFTLIYSSIWKIINNRKTIPIKFLQRGKLTTIIRPSSGRGSLSQIRRFHHGAYSPSNSTQAPKQQFQNSQGASIIANKPATAKATNKSSTSQFRNAQGAALTSKSYYNKAGQYITENYGNYEQQVAYDKSQRSFAKAKAQQYYKDQDAKAYKQDIIDKQKASKLYRTQAPLTEQGRYSLYAKLSPQQNVLGKEKGLLTTSFYGSPQKNFGYTPNDIAYFKQKEKQAYDSRPRSTMQKVFPFFRPKYDDSYGKKFARSYGEQYATAGTVGAALGAGGVASGVIGGGAVAGTVAAAPAIGIATLGAMAGLGAYYGHKQTYLTVKAGMASRKAGGSFWVGAFGREKNRAKSMLSWTKKNPEIVGGVTGGLTGGIGGYYSGFKYSQNYDVAHARIVKFTDTKVNRYGKAETPKSRFDASTEVQVGDKMFKVKSYGRGKEFINAGRKISVGKVKVKQDIYYYNKDGKSVYYKQGGTAIKGMVNLGKRPRYDMFSQSKLDDKISYRLTYGRATKVLKEPSKLMYSVSNKDVTKQYVGLGRQRYQFKLKSSTLSDKDFTTLMAKPKGESIDPFVSGIRKYYSARRGVVEGSFGYVERTKGVKTTTIVGSGKSKDTFLEYYKGGQSYSVSYKPKTTMQIGRVAGKMFVTKKAGLSLFKPETGVSYRRSLVGIKRAPPLYSESIKFSSKDLAGQAFLQLSKMPKFELLGAGALGALAGSRLKSSSDYKRRYQPYVESLRFSTPVRSFSLSTTRQSPLSIKRTQSTPSLTSSLVQQAAQEATTTPRLDFFRTPTYDRPPAIPMIDIPPPPPIIPLLGELPNFDLQRGLGKNSVLRSQRKKYTPSLIALDLKIRGKAPKKISGFEIRPLSGKRRKKK